MKDYPFSLKLKNKFDPIINLDRIYEYGSGRHILEKVFENENEISKLATEDLKMLNTEKFKLQVIELFIVPYETSWTVLNLLKETAKLFFMYGGDNNSIMEWYKIKYPTAENVIYSNLDERKYWTPDTKSYKINDCELIHSSVLQNSMFINLSLPHRINNSNSSKKIHIISCSFEDKQYEIENNKNNDPMHHIKALSIEEAFNTYNNLIEK